MPNIGPTAYGTVFPTTGLYNGYTFKIFLTNPAGGSNMYETIYRADLDGTYPWHVTGPPVHSSGWSISTSSGSYVVCSGTAFTIPRAGNWHVRFGGLAGGGISGSETINMTLSYPSVGTLQAQGPTGGFSASVMTEGLLSSVPVSTAISMYALSTQAGTATSLSNGFITFQPLKLI